MDKLITIYHGSERIVETPTFGEGKKNNDFGLGFYCTESDDLANLSLKHKFSRRSKATAAVSRIAARLEGERVLLPRLKKI